MSGIRTEAAIVRYPGRARLAPHVSDPQIHLHRDLRALVRCAARENPTALEGSTCKRAVATAVLRYSYRFTTVQLHVLADLYVDALNRLEPEALVRVRERMCDPASEESREMPRLPRRCANDCLLIFE